MIQKIINFLEKNFKIIILILATLITINFIIFSFSYTYFSLFVPYQENAPLRKCLKGVSSKDEGKGYGYFHSQCYKAYKK
jgi:capsular polysaccharide biosynthesis protein